MTVGVNGQLGKPMIREGQGFHIQVRRSLRDVFRKVPTLSIEVQVCFFFTEICFSVFLTTIVVYCSKLDTKDNDSMMLIILCSSKDIDFLCFCSDFILI